MSQLAVNQYKEIKQFIFTSVPVQNKKYKQWGDHFRYVDLSDRIGKNSLLHKVIGYSHNILKEKHTKRFRERSTI